MKGNIFYFKVLLHICLITGAGCTKKQVAQGIISNQSDTVPKALFQKYPGNPVFDIGAGQPLWRNIHAANVSILAPAETPDGKWRLFLRGSGNNSGGYHDNIGTFSQPASGFNPVGQWTENTGNPTLQHGYPGSYDAQHVLDAAAASGPGNNIYLYYMGRDANNRSSLNGSMSVDGGTTFTKFTNNPLRYDVGPNDMVYANGKYYLFFGDAKYNGSSFDEPLQIWLSQSLSPDLMSSNPTYALRVGSTGAFDSYSVNGAKIFKAGTDNRYFMLYQCSTKNFDYPERLHCAWSDDLVNWSKVNNSQPLLSRGQPCEFDQGAIWTGSVIENDGMLYIYYEGWGSLNNDAAIRDNPYYGGGNSRVGVASCTVNDFLKWVK